MKPYEHEKVKQAIHECSEVVERLELNLAETYETFKALHASAKSILEQSAKQTEKEREARK